MESRREVGSLTLPAGPGSLCFNKDEFLKDDFDVDNFVSESRKHVQLETLRDDLELYYKLLKTAMVELINKDYADFVNLSTNLVGMDKALNHLTVPLGQLKEEVKSLKLAVSEGIQAIDDRLAKEDDIRRKKLYSFYTLLKQRLNSKCQPTLSPKCQPIPCLYGCCSVDSHVTSPAGT